MSLITTIKTKLEALEVEALTEIHALCNQLACRGEAAPKTKEAIVADIEGKARSLGTKALSALHEFVTTFPSAPEAAQIPAAAAAPAEAAPSVQ